MGPPIIAAVKANSLTMTELKATSLSQPRKHRVNKGRNRTAYTGTAGAKSDFPDVGGTRELLSSFSKRVFSSETMRWEVMVVGLHLQDTPALWSGLNWHEGQGTILVYRLRPTRDSSSPQKCENLLQKRIHSRNLPLTSSFQNWIWT